MKNTTVTHTIQPGFTPQAPLSVIDRIQALETQLPDVTKQVRYLTSYATSLVRVSNGVHKNLATNILRVEEQVAQIQRHLTTFGTTAVAMDFVIRNRLTDESHPPVPIEENVIIGFYDPRPWVPVTGPQFGPDQIGQVLPLNSETKVQAPLPRPPTRTQTPLDCLDPSVTANRMRGADQGAEAPGTAPVQLPPVSLEADEDMLPVSGDDRPHNRNGNLDHIRGC